MKERRQVKYSVKREEDVSGGEGREGKVTLTISVT